MESKPVLTRSRPEELIFEACYAPVDLGRLLEDADSRSRIRKLPLAQIYYALDRLDFDRLPELLPHLTEEQWQGILDLDLWRRDHVDPGRFLHWHQMLLGVDAPVGRKLLRAADPVLWELVLGRFLEVYRRDDDEEFEGAAPLGREFMQTPDGNFLVVFPKNPEAARLLGQIVLKLYELEEEQSANLLTALHFRTHTELQEDAYQRRKLRLEDQGFQDYFDAIEIYTPRSPEEVLPTKSWESQEVHSVLPTRVFGESRGLLLMEVLSQVEDSTEVRYLLEEIFYVCNKLLSADRVSPSDPERVKSRIRKALSGINLGLDQLAEGDLAQAVRLVRRRYLKHLFQIGYQRLIRLREAAQDLEADPGSLDETFLEGLRRTYPVRTVLSKGRPRRRYFRDLRGLKKAQRTLRRLADAS